MIRWLGIHYKFPPVATVSSRRLFQLYQAMDQISGELVVVSSAEVGKRPQEVAYTHNWTVHSVAGRGLREYLYGRKSNTVPHYHKQRPGYDALVRLRETVPFEYFLGEGGPIYRGKAYQTAARLVESEQITHLFSSFRPWADHLIAARLKARFPNLHWIADFRDLPIDPLRNPPYGLKWHRQRLRKRLAAVDQVWTVSEGLAQELRKFHPDVVVVPSGLTQLPAPTDFEADLFRINYSGSIYPGLQKIDLLLEAIRKLSAQNLLDPTKIELQYAGKDGAVFSSWVKNSGLPLRHNIQDQLPLAKALEQQRSCHLNLLLSWSAANYQGILTAKLYDYLAAGRPILTLVNGPDDPEIRSIIEGSGSGKVFCTYLSSSERTANSPLERLKPAGVQMPIETWLLSLYQQWEQNAGRLPWSAAAEKLVSLQPLPILRQLLSN